MVLEDKFVFVLTASVARYRRTGQLGGDNSRTVGSADRGFYRPSFGRLGAAQPSSQYDSDPIHSSQRDVPHLKVVHHFNCCNKIHNLIMAAERRRNLNFSKTSAEPADHAKTKSRNVLVHFRGEPQDVCGARARIPRARTSV